MGLFSKKNLSINQINTINKILPENLQKPDWTEGDFKGADSIYKRVELNLEGLISSVTTDNEGLKKLNKKLHEIAVKNIKIFNTEPFDAELLGMIDIGVIHRFGASSTGDRFTGGAIGYAIESVIDDTWTKSNIQENAVNEVKYKLLEKAKHFYPDCNLFFKYDVDFREIGSSGNVFIYMRGTAAKGENTSLDSALQKAKTEIVHLEKNIEKKKETIQYFREVKSKIPQSPKQIEEYLGKG
ncbi:hypothetical protein ED312_04595 [Sinomicrobium pectinilyticum]|uniref:Uncharacterized protein n=1 Tax=Sinomicrobium pectinilyticum TaxID=1084421 RepID=A0A3N0EU69_SINP1|nr:hypothetical protein [Sinomicrobium pectinilyticum]RNL91453.1 hypothetical protein ED312_04595 [Sinomicrobium pectinilyticum]